MNSWLGLVVGAAASITAVPIAMRVAPRVGLLDRPGPLKTHERPVPYLGGAAVFTGLLIVAVIAGHPLLIVPPVLALALGLADDAHPLPVAVRLIASVAVGVAAALVGGASSAWSVALGILVTVIAVNAVNFVDGIDGLAAGVCAAGAGGLAVALTGDWSAVAAGLAGAAAGFLVFNRPPARIYLGDAGSYLLGASLATFAIHVVTHAHRPVPALAIAAVGAYPLVELVSTVGRRLARGQSPFAGDRDHAYDRLVRAGWSKPVAVSALVAGHAVLVVGGVLAVRAHSAAGAVAVLAALAVLATVATATVLGHRSTP